MCRQARVQWQLAWARCPNSSPPLWRSSWQPPLMEKHDSNPSIQTPECHSEISGQIIHQWDIVPPLLRPLQQRWSGVFSATERLWSNNNLTVISTASLKYGCFFTWPQWREEFSQMFSVSRVFGNRWTHHLKHFCPDTLHTSTSYLSIKRHPEDNSLLAFNPQ